MDSTTFPSKYRGFTLIELIAVIAIIIILIALLIPGARMVRKNMEIAECTGNLRTLGQALHLYAADNGGEMLKASDQRRDNFGMWYRTITPYIEGRTQEDGSFVNDASDVLVCPAYERMVEDGELNGNGFRVWQYGYGMNMALRNESRGFGFNMFTMNDDGERNPNQADYRLSNISYPTARVVFATHPGWNINFPNASTEGFQWYSGRGNVCFVDGHVDLLEPQQIVDGIYDPAKLLQKEQDNEGG